MDLLKKKNLEKTLNKYAIEKKKPLLGICLGMQLLLSRGYEFGEFNGLNFIPGDVKNINKVSKIQLKVPNIGWNNIQVNKNHKLYNHFNNLSFYFVHSYISITENKADTVAHCNYFDADIPSIIQKGKIIGCQFHPEKSGENGLKFLKTFCDLI